MYKLRSARRPNLLLQLIAKSLSWSGSSAAEDPTHHSLRTSDTEKKSNNKGFFRVLMALILFSDDKIHQATAYVSESDASEQDHAQI